MSSRLLSRLEGQIASATDPVVADCLRADRASYLARQGRFDEASAALRALHERYDSRPHIEVSIRLNLVEGLVSYFTNMGRASVDKILRAHALSAASGNMPLRALCSAWLAHIDFGMHKFDRMATHLIESLGVAAKSDHGAIARACLVAAEAFHLANRYDLAAPWYQRARNHASVDGDDATVSALMHNMTWMHTENLRQDVVARGSQPVRAGFELAGVESTESFDQLVGATSLNTLIPLLRAQVLSLRGSFQSALAIYAGCIEPAKQQGLHRLLASILAERAWCYLQVGQPELAHGDATASEANLLPETQVDDRAAMHSRLAQVYAALAMHDLAKHHQGRADEAWAEFTGHQSRIVQLLSALPNVDHFDGQMDDIR